MKEHRLASLDVQDPLDVSRHATMVPNGTLESGKIADLIVVDGNPLDDLSALWNTELVVKDGDVVVGNRMSGGRRQPRNVM